MASVVGRSCSYGVHLRFCSPSASVSPLAPLSRLASCFFLRFSFSSSCRNHRSKFCTFPPPYYHRTVNFAHSEAEQDGSSSSSVYCSQLPAVKRMSSQKKKNLSTEEAATEPFLGDQGNNYAQTTACEDTSASLLPTKKVRRKKVDVLQTLPLSEDLAPMKKVRKNKLDGLEALPLSEDGLPEDIVAKKKSSGKKMVRPHTGTIDSTEKILSNGTIPELDEKKSPLRRSSRKKKSISPELKGTLENASSPRLQKQTSELHMIPLDTLPETPRKSTRRKRTVLVEQEVSASQEKTRSAREDHNTIKEDSTVEVIQVKRGRKKKSLSSQLTKEGSLIHVNSETATACRKEPADITEPETSKSVTTLAAKEEGIPMSLIFSSEEVEKETTWNKEPVKIAGGKEGSEIIASLVANKNVLQEQGTWVSRRNKASTRADAATLETASSFESKVVRLTSTSGGSNPLKGRYKKSDVLSRKREKVSKVTLQSSSGDMDPTVVPVQSGTTTEKEPSNLFLSAEMVSSEKSLAPKDQKASAQEELEKSTLIKVRSVDNSVDKASLTDELPIIAFVDGHLSSSRKSHSELPRNTNLNKSWVDEEAASEKIMTASPKLRSILEDFARNTSGGLVKGKEKLASLNYEQSRQRLSGEDSVQNVQTGESTFDENGLKNSDKLKVANHLGGSEQMELKRSIRGTERGYRSKELCAGNNNNGVLNNKQANTFTVSGKANQTKAKYGSQHSRSGSVDRVDAPSAEGFSLANMHRASGTEKKERKQFSVRKVLANQASTLSYMQIYGTGFDTGDTMPTVLLFFDRRRFIFNVGEGLQRFCMEHRFKLAKIDHVFLTRVCSETAGGLPGLILTLAELGETGQTVQTWGPSSLKDLAQALRTFVPSSWMDHAHCFAPTEDDGVQSKSGSSPPLLVLEDELIKISAVLLHSTSDEGNGDVSKSSVKGEYCNMVSTVYICELSEVKGKFDPAKALAKGLKPGPSYGRLQRGESVMSDDGTTMVLPEDVLGPSSPGPVMLLVDCPSMLYVPSLVSCASLQSYFSQIGKTVNCMIHLGPTSVTKSSKYKCWMENFKETHHIMARQDSEVLGTPTLMYSAKVLLKLSHVCPRLFSVAEPDAVNIMEGERNNIHTGENLLKFHFRPLANLGLDSSDVPQAFIRAAIEDTWSKEFSAVETARQIVERAFNTSQTLRGEYESIPPCLQHVSREEMELVFLGTGSSQPSKHRNVTGIYIHLFDKGGLLLDCGEGTYAQLKRRYGAKGAEDVLRGLKCIWISHMHADHFVGLPRILSARRQLLSGQSTGERRILLIGPRSLRPFLDAYEKVEDLRVEYLDCSQTTPEVRNRASSGNVPPKMGLIHASLGSGRGAQGGLQHYWRQPGFHIQQGIDCIGREKLKNVLSSLGLKDLISVPVVHCPNAFAVVLEAQGRKLGESKTDGWKLVFSGDTRPCKALVEAARGATIFIHEATFDDGMIADAVKKNHSMTKEAIEVGVAADVYRIFLTHFSQRYPSIPFFDTHYCDRTCIAFDMMSVNLVDLPIVPKIVPALQVLFKDEGDAEGEEDLIVSV